MQNETRQCQNCKSAFVIEPDDFGFYEKVKVPPPTWCPTCRMTRRLAFGNAWGVHFRNCDKCGIKTLTMYRPEDPTKVFCDPCWWADDWDGTEYAMDYDPSRNFLEQWSELRSKTPHYAKDALYTSLKNCDYTNAIAFSKDCYMTFWADYCEYVYHSAFLNTVKDTLDVFRAYKSELCYQSVGLGRCNKMFFSHTCDDCSNVWFSRNCYGCSDCIGCVNLRGKNYCILNQQYSKEDYTNKVKELRLDTRDGIHNFKKRAHEFWHTLPYREYTGNSQNLNVSGDYIYESKNAHNCYMCSGVEDSKYCQFVSVPKAENCMDYYGWGNGASLAYETAVSGEDIQNIKFSFGCFGSGMNLEYCGFCIGAKNNFGCANLKRREYCILNKQYSKDDFQKLRDRIVEDMKSNPYVDSLGRIYPYGEFFPPQFAPFPYIDSNASKFFEKTKEQALQEGYNWADKTENTYQKTISGNELPQSIAETTESVLNEIIGCTVCGRCYRIPQGEFVLYQKMNLPIASECPKCREKERFTVTNMPKTYEANCARCAKAIKTMHDPVEGKIVYCESCYQQEIV